MPLQYALIPNPLTDDPDDYVARVVSLPTKTVDDIIDEMIGRGSTVTRAEALSVLEEYNAAVEDLLREGYRINTPLLNFGLSVQGVFYDADEAFDASKHQVRVNVNPGVRLRQLSSQVALQRVSPSVPAPQPLDYEDANTGSRNGSLTPGGVGTLTGSRLQYEANDPQQGVFFIDAAGSETRVAVLARNMPKELTFQVPSTLTTGAYTVDVRVVLPNATQLRVGHLPHTLQVP